MSKITAKNRWTNSTSPTVHKLGKRLPFCLIAEVCGVWIRASVPLQLHTRLGLKKQSC